MICNECGKELEADEIICAQCGYDNTPEQDEEPKAKINPWKIAFPSVLCVGLLLVLSWLLFYGVNGYWIPRANDVYKKDSYTANDDRLSASSNTVVATLGENKLTNSQLQIFYGKACNDFKGQFSTSKRLDEQIYDQKTGLTWQQYLLETSLNIWKQYRFLTDMALEAGFTLPSEYQNSLDMLQKNLATSAANNNFSSVDALIASQFGEGCTFEDYKYFMELNYYASLYFQELTEGITCTQDEIEAFYNAHKDEFAENDITKESGFLIDYRHIFIEAQAGTDGITDVQWEECKTTAQNLLDQWLENPTEEIFATIATETSDDESTSSNGGLCVYIYNDYLTTVDIRHILIMPEGGTKDANGKTVYTDEEWEACRKKAQEIYDKYLNGELTEEAFAELAKTHSQDGNAEQGGIYTDVQKGSMTETFDAWIFDESREAGDTGLVKTQYGYHVMYFSHRDDAMNDWLFGTEHKTGDYGLVKTDDGYQIIYIVEAEEGWIRLSKNSLENEKAGDLLDELNEQYQISVQYGKIRLCQ